MTFQDMLDRNREIERVALAARRAEENHDHAARSAAERRLAQLLQIKTGRWT
jgi:hypothetical protein